MPRVVEPPKADGPAGLSSEWDQGRAQHLLRHLGAVRAGRLSLREGDAYRPAGGPASRDSARLDVCLTVPPGTDADAARRALVHALARLVVRRVLAASAEDDDESRRLLPLQHGQAGLEEH